MTGGIRVYVSGALVFAIAFVICVRALGSTAAPFDSCDRAGVVDEGARTFDGDLCAGDDPNDTVMTLKAATIAADVLCRNSNWKQVPLHSDAWETMGWSECGQAPEGGTPICEAMFSAAFYYGVENGKHVFKRVVESARWDGNGCVWEAGDRVTLEHKEWSAPGVVPPDAKMNRHARVMSRVSTEHQDARATRANATNRSSVIVPWDLVPSMSGGTKNASAVNPLSPRS